MKSTFEFLVISSAMSGAGAVAPGQRIDSGEKMMLRVNPHICGRRIPHPPPIYDGTKRTWEVAYVGG